MFDNYVYLYIYIITVHYRFDSFSYCHYHLMYIYNEIHIDRMDVSAENHEHAPMHLRGLTAHQQERRTSQTGFRGLVL